MKSILLAATATAFAISANATEIDVTGLLQPAITLTLEPGSNVQVNSLGFIGAATYGPDSGVADFGPMSFLAGPASATHHYPAAGAETVTYTGFDLDTMTMALTWKDLFYNPSASGEPQLTGMGVVTNSSGDAAFLADFGVGAKAAVSGNFPTQCSIDNFDDGACVPLQVAIGFFEGGNIISGSSPPPPPPPEVPEPSTLTLLLTALLGFGWLYSLHSKRIAT